MTITQSVDANAVFVLLPEQVASRLQERFHFYTWDQATGEVRWMCAWDTTESDVDDFVAAVRGKWPPVPEGHVVHSQARRLRTRFRGSPVRVDSPQGRFAADARRIDGQ